MPRISAPSHPDKHEIIVIGAGVAGLTAAAELAEAGFSVVVLEARNRIGGRVYTIHDAGENFPVELGAEFIHGQPPEIMGPLRESKIPVHEVDGDNWCFQDGGLRSCDFFSEVDEILQRMNDRGPDESFADFLERCCPDASAENKQRALGYVSGFNAADPAKVSVHWLVQQIKAEEKISGDRAFRARGGYQPFLETLQARAIQAGVKIEPKTAVRRVAWSPREVAIDAMCNQKAVTHRANRVVVTVPLGVLKAKPGEPGAVEFSPALPQEKLNAIAGMEMGKVLRVVLHFRKRFWQRIHPGGDRSKTLDRMSFLFSQDERFPTWWTAMPDKFPIITGWAPWRAAEKLESGKLSVVEHALHSLGDMLDVNPDEIRRLLESAHFHDWQADPFSRGAYSYTTAGNANASEILERPLEDTLFFAGEAADISGNNGTVHGAIASARRAVRYMTEREQTSAAD